MSDFADLPDPARLFERAACGLLLTDTNGLIRRVNATFCRWLGYQAEDLVDKRRVQDLFTIGGRVFHQTHLAPLLQMQGSVAEVQLDMRHADGHPIPMLYNTVRTQVDGQVFDEMAVFVATDRRKYEHELLLARKTAEQNLQALTVARQELRELNEELARADRKKDEFLATLAHELRNPLAPLRHVLEILKLKNSPDPQLVWAREVFERQMQQMSHLVDDLMEISRITQGRIELRREPTDVRAIMGAAVEASDAAIRAARHTLSLSPPSAAVMMNADPTRLTQILTNLLNNAAKYTPDGGSIWFEAEVDGGEVLLRVRDSGIGIAPDNLENVFTMFAQLEPGLPHSQGGLGIGLALVKGLVALHGGSVVAESAGIGQGSAFTVRLQVLELASADEPVEAAQPAPAATRGRRILVVDDNRDAADMLHMALGLLGHEVDCAYDGATALAMGESLLPDVMVLDIGLPDMDGYEVARRARTQAWGRKVVLIAATGWGQQTDRDKAQAAGFDHHMVKPIDFLRLDAVLKAS
ncbi:MAG: ATP-binding protein [Pseudomonadota bacterium]